MERGKEGGREREGGREGKRERRSAQVDRLARHPRCDRRVPPARRTLRRCRAFVALVTAVAPAAPVAPVAPTTTTATAATSRHARRAHARRPHDDRADQSDAPAACSHACQDLFHVRNRQSAAGQVCSTSAAGRRQRARSTGARFAPARPCAASL